MGKIVTGGDTLSHSLDRNIGNWDLISLNFTPHTPMAYRKKRQNHLVFIEIDVGVATNEGVCFTDCNATRTRNGQCREKGLKGLGNVKFNIINGPPKLWDQDWKKYVQAEILVPEFIPIESFKAIHFISNASSEYGTLLCDEYHELFCVKEETFADIDYKNRNRWTIQFSYLRKLLISTNEVTKENVDTISITEESIIQGEMFWAIVRLYAVTGTKISIVINPDGQKKEWVFDSSSDWVWWPYYEAPYSELVTIEVYVNDILWIKRKIRAEK